MNHPYKVFKIVPEEFPSSGVKLPLDKDKMIENNIKYLNKVAERNLKFVAQLNDDNFHFQYLIGFKVRETSKNNKEPKQFKSGFKYNTVKGVIKHPILNTYAFTFEEDDSYVECSRCQLVEKVFDLPPRFIYDEKIESLKKEISVLNHRKLALERQKNDALNGESKSFRALSLIESKEGFYFFLENNPLLGIKHSNEKKYNFHWILKDNEFKCWATAKNDSYGNSGSHCLTFLTIEEAEKSIKPRLESSLRSLSSNYSVAQILGILEQAKKYGVTLEKTKLINLFDDIKENLVKERDNLLFNADCQNKEIEQLNITVTALCEN